MKKSFASYKPAKVFTRRGDLDKEWYVEFKFFDPDKNDFKRIRETNNANRIHDPVLRLKCLQSHANALNKRLAEGWNPLEKRIDQHVVYSEDSWETCVHIILADKAQSVQAASLSQYRYVLQYFTQFLRNRRMSTDHPRNITKNTVIDYLTWRISSFKIRRGSRDKDLVILVSAFKVLKLRGIIKDNPASDIPRLGDRPEKHEPYTPQELRKLMNYLEDNDRKMLHFCILVMSAIRPAEILRLQVKDIDIANGVVVIKNTKSKNAYSRVSRIPAVLLSYLADFDISGYPASYYVFNPTGKPCPFMHRNKWYWSRAFSNVRNKLNLRRGITMYSLKHTILIEMYKNGASMDELMSYGGFRTLDALQAYLRRHLNHVPADPSDRLKGLFQ